MMSAVAPSPPIGTGANRSGVEYLDPIVFPSARA